MTGALNRSRGAVVTLAAGAGGLSLAAAAAGLFGGVDPWLDLFTHFAPIWFLGGLFAAITGPTLGRGGAGRLLTAVGVLAVLAAGARLAPEALRPVRPAVAPGAGARLRLIEFNAWDENADPVAAAAWIAGQSPDVVTVAEATPALRTAMAVQGFSAVDGMVSTAIFSRGLLRRPSFQVPFRDWTRVPDFARARFAVGAGPATFTVVAVHVSWPTLASHWPQREAFVRLLAAQHRERLIVAGDFNLTPWSFGLATFDDGLGLERRDRAVPSWPAMRRIAGVLTPLPAFLPIDHVYAGPQWRTVAVRRGPRLGSDHYPLIVDLALQP